LDPTFRQGRVQCLPYRNPRSCFGRSPTPSRRRLQLHRPGAEKRAECPRPLSSGETPRMHGSTPVSLKFPVHKGVSRSPSIIIAYLIRNTGMTFDNALAFTKHQRACVKPNSGFVAILREWEDYWRRPASARRTTA